MLEDRLTSIKGIGPRRAELFGKLGLASLYELLYFLPRDYKDYSLLRTAESCAHGEDVVLHLTIDAEPKLARIRGSLNILSVAAHDTSGKIRLVWYNQPYRKEQLHAGMEIYACGRIDREKGLRMVNPMLSPVLPGILPVYPLVQGLNQRILRETMKAALELGAGALEETLPAFIREENALPAIEDAIRAVHFPADMEALKAARKRLAFEDMLLFRLMLAILRQRREQGGGIAFIPADADAFFDKLPFAPTDAQKRAIGEIAADMASPSAMNRLLQGDVGSGKTMPALYAMQTAVQNGYQAVLLAPTEVLARQHFHTVETMFEGDALLLQGGMKKSEKEAAYAAIASGACHAIVGTHALLQEGLQFHKLGLVIADEQHRFGVRQRAKLKDQGQADMLIMSATPIPRTLTLLLYGDLELSVLDELPPGRKPVLTRLVPETKKAGMYAFIVEQIEHGRQAYVVCPLIEASEETEETISATALYKELKRKLPMRVGLLHGQMKSADKEKTLEAFRRGEIQLLVSTTVIEVGIDVPNASVMVVESADRFGLAQLHQLRGRVGRGAEASYCFLCSESQATTAKERLSILTKTQNGFEIAQKDLQMRGPGEVLGQRQHGLSEFAAICLAADMETLTSAQKAADALLNDPQAAAQGARLLQKAADALQKNENKIAMN